MSFLSHQNVWTEFEESSFCSSKLINPVQPPWFVWTRVADSLEVVTGIVMMKGEGRWCLVARGRQAGPLTLYKLTNWQGRVMSCCRLLVDPRPIPGILCQEHITSHHITSQHNTSHSLATLTNTGPSAVANREKLLTFYLTGFSIDR